MCGIAGIVDPAGIDRVVLDRMRDVMVHRGPDDAGSIALDSAGLASRRLAIIDISPDGHQPMTYGPFTITYNGEIYNYLELRAELEQLGHRFVSQSDTEVVLHAYAEWKGSCLERFNGMFAFAIWDDHAGELFAARDRFGERPFFYTTVGTSFIFASELKSLFEYPGLRPEPNNSAIFRFLAFAQLTMPEESFFTNIKRLPAAHSLRWNSRTISVSRYFALSRDELSIPYEAAVEEFRELFRDSVRLRLRSDVPVGSSLSGGVDSSSIVSMVSKVSPDQRRMSFSARFRGFHLDEGRFIDDVVRCANVESHAVFPTDSDLADDLEALVYCQEEPFTSSSIYAQWRVMKLANAHGIKVLLDGQGADELLGGYPAYSTSFFMSSVRERPTTFLREITGWRSKHGLQRSRVLGGLWMGGYPAIAAPAVERLAARMYRRDVAMVNPEFAHAHANMWHPPRHSGLDSFRAALLTTQQVSILPGLLRYADRNAMAHSVEVRLPYLDHRLADFAFRLPASYKIHNGVTKRILRDAVADLLPESVSSRVDKVGFVTPEAQWMRGGFRELMADVIHSHRFRQRAVFAPRAVEQLWREHESGLHDHSSATWRALVLELWFEAFLDRESSFPRRSRVETALVEAGH
jgi:asparagine synthase (glutamine-hydrolysing)